MHVYVVAAKRTPLGLFNGLLKDLSAVDGVLQQISEDTGVELDTLKRRTNPNGGAIAI